MVTRILNIETINEQVIQAYKGTGLILISKRHPDSDTVQSTIFLEKNEAKVLGEELIKLSEELI